MSLEKKISDIMWSAVLLPDRTIKTAFDGIAELTTNKAGVDRYRLAQAAIISGGAVAAVSAAGYLLGEPRSIQYGMLAAALSAVELTVTPFFLTPGIKKYAPMSADVKSPLEPFFKLTRASRFPMLLGSTLGLIGLHEVLNNIGTPGGISELGTICISFYFYLIDGTTNRWQQLRDFYKRLEESFSVRKRQAQPGTDAFASQQYYC